MKPILCIFFFFLQVVLDFCQITLNSDLVPQQISFHLILLACLIDENAFKFFGVEAQVLFSTPINDSLGISDRFHIDFAA